MWAEFPLRVKISKDQPYSHPETLSKYEHEVKYVTFTIDHASPNTIAVMKDASQMYQGISAWVGILKTNAQGNVIHNLKYLTEFQSYSAMGVSFQHQDKWLISALIKQHTDVAFYLIFIQMQRYPRPSSLVTPSHDMIYHQDLSSKSLQTMRVAEGMEIHYLKTLAAIISHCANNHQINQSYREFSVYGEQRECSLVITSGRTHDNLLVRKRILIDLVFHKRYTHLSMKKVSLMETYGLQDEVMRDEITEVLVLLKPALGIHLSANSKPVIASPYPKELLWKYYTGHTSTRVRKQEHLITQQWVEDLVDMVTLSDMTKVDHVTDAKSLLLMSRNNHQVTVGLLMPLELIFPNPSSDWESEHVFFTHGTKTSVDFRSSGSNKVVKRTPVVAYIAVMRYCSDPSDQDSRFMYGYHHYDCTAAVSSLSLKLFRTEEWVYNTVLLPGRLAGNIMFQTRFMQTLVMIEVVTRHIIEKLSSVRENEADLSYITKSVSAEGHTTRLQGMTRYMLDVSIFSFKRKPDQLMTGRGTHLIKYQLPKTSHQIYGREPGRIKLTIMTLTATMCTMGILSPVEKFPCISGYSFTTRTHAFRPFSRLTQHLSDKDTGEQQVVWNVQDMFSDKVRYCAHKNTISITDEIDLGKYDGYDCTNVLISHPTNDDVLFLTTFRVAELDRKVFLRSQLKRNLRMLTQAYHSCQARYNLGIAIDVQLAHWFKTFGTQTRIVQMAAHTNEAMITVFKRSLESKKELYENKRRKKVHRPRQTRRGIEEGSHGPKPDRTLSEEEYSKHLSSPISFEDKEDKVLEHDNIPKTIEDRDAGMNENTHLDLLQDNDKIDNVNEVSDEDLIHFKKREVLNLKKTEEEVLNLKKRSSAKIQRKKTQTTAVIVPRTGVVHSWTHETTRTTTCHESQLSERFYQHQKTFFSSSNLGSTSCSYTNYVEILYVRGYFPRTHPPHNIKSFSSLIKRTQGLEVTDSDTFQSVKFRGGLVISRNRCYPRSSCELETLTMPTGSYELGHFSWLITVIRTPIMKQSLMMYQVFQHTGCLVHSQTKPLIQITSDTVTTVEYERQVWYSKTPTRIDVIEEWLIRPTKKQSNLVIRKEVSTSMARLFYHYQEIIITQKQTSRKTFRTPKFVASAVHQLHVTATGAMMECLVRPVLKSQVMLIVNNLNLKQMHGKFSDIEFIHVYHEAKQSTEPAIAHEQLVYKRFCWIPVENVGKFVSGKRMRSEIARRGFKHVDSIILDGVEENLKRGIGEHCKPIYIISYGRITFKMQHSTIRAATIVPKARKMYVIYKTLYTAAGVSIFTLKPDLTFTASTSQEAPSLKQFRIITVTRMLNTRIHDLARPTRQKVKVKLIPRAGLGKFNYHSMAVHPKLTMPWSALMERFYPTSKASWAKTIMIQRNGAMLEVRTHFYVVKLSSSFEKKHTCKCHVGVVSLDNSLHVLKKALIVSKPNQSFVLSLETCKQVNQGKSFSTPGKGCATVKGEGKPSGSSGSSGSAGSKSSSSVSKVGSSGKKTDSGSSSPSTRSSSSSGSKGKSKYRNSKGGPARDKVCKAQSAKEVLGIDTNGDPIESKGCNYLAIGNSVEIPRVDSFAKTSIAEREVKVVSLIKSLNYVATKISIVKTQRKNPPTKVVINPAPRARTFHVNYATKPTVSLVRWRQRNPKTTSSFKKFLRFIKPAIAIKSNTPQFILMNHSSLMIILHPAFKKVSTYTVRYQASSKHIISVLPHKIKVLAHAVTEPPKFKFACCKTSQNASFIDQDKKVFSRQGDVSLMMFRTTKFALSKKKTNSQSRMTTVLDYKNVELRFQHKSSAQAVEFYYGFGTFDCNQCSSNGNGGGNSGYSGSSNNGLGSAGAGYYWDCERSKITSGGSNSGNQKEGGAGSGGKGSGDKGNGGKGSVGNDGGGNGSSGNGTGGSTESGRSSNKKCIRRRRKKCAQIQCKSQGEQGCQTSINHMYQTIGGSYSGGQYSGSNYAQLRISQNSRLDALRCMICTTCTTIEGAQGKKKVDLSTVKVVNFCPGEVKKQRFRKREFDPYHYCIHGLDGPYYWIMPYTNYFIIWGFGLNTRVFDFSIFYSFYNHYYFRYSYSYWPTRAYNFYISSRTRGYYPPPNRSVYTMLTNNPAYPPTFCLCSFYYSMNIKLMQPQTITQTFDTIVSTSFSSFSSMSSIYLPRYNINMWRIPFRYEVSFRRFNNPIPNININFRSISIYMISRYGVNSARSSFTLRFGVNLRISFTQGFVRLSPQSPPTMRQYNLNQPQHTYTTSFRNQPIDYWFVFDQRFMDFNPRHMSQMLKFSRSVTSRSVFSTSRYVIGGTMQQVLHRYPTYKNLVLVQRPYGPNGANLKRIQFTVLTPTTQAISRHTKQMISQRIIMNPYRLFRNQYYPEDILDPDDSDSGNTELERTNLPNNYQLQRHVPPRMLKVVIQRNELDEKILKQVFKIPVLVMKQTPLGRFETSSDHKTVTSPSWTLSGFAYAHNNHLPKKVHTRSYFFKWGITRNRVTRVPRKNLIVMIQSITEQVFPGALSRKEKPLSKTTSRKSIKHTVIYPYKLFTHRMTVTEGWKVTEMQVGIRKDSVAVNKWNENTRESLRRVNPIQFVTTQKAEPPHTLKQSSSNTVTKPSNRPINSGGVVWNTDLTFKTKRGRTIVFRFTQHSQKIFKFIHHKVSDWSTPTVKKGRVVKSDTYEKTETIIQKKVWDVVATDYNKQEKHTFSRSTSRQSVETHSGKEIMYGENVKDTETRLTRPKTIYFQKMVLYLLRMRTLTSGRESTAAIMTIKTSTRVLKEEKKDHRIDQKVWHVVKTFDEIKEGHSKQFSRNIQIIRQTYEQFIGWTDKGLADVDVGRLLHVRKSIDKIVGHIKRTTHKESTQNDHKTYTFVKIFATLVKNHVETVFMVFEVLTVHTIKSFKTEKQHTFTQESSAREHSGFAVRDRTMEVSTDDTGVKYKANVFVRFIKTENAVARFFFIEFMGRKYHHSSKFLDSWERTLQFVATSEKKVKRWYVKLRFSHRFEKRHVFEKFHSRTLVETTDYHFREWQRMYTQHIRFAVKFGAYEHSTQKGRSSTQFLHIESTRNFYRQYTQFVFAVSRRHSYLLTEEKQWRVRYVIKTFKKHEAKHTVELFHWHKTSKWDNYTVRRKIIATVDRGGAVATISRAVLQKKFAYYGHRMEVRRNHRLDGADAIRFAYSVTITDMIDKDGVALVKMHHKYLTSDFKLTGAKKLRLFHTHVLTKTLTYHAARSQYNRKLILSFNTRAVTRQGAVEKIGIVAMFGFDTSKLAELHKTKTMWYAVARMISFTKTEGEVKEWVLYKIRHSFSTTEGPKVVLKHDMVSNHWTHRFGRDQTDVAAQRSSKGLRVVYATMHQFKKWTRMLITLGNIGITRNITKRHEVVVKLKIWYQVQDSKTIEVIEHKIVLRKRVEAKHTIKLAHVHTLRQHSYHEAYRNWYQRKLLISFQTQAVTRSLFTKKTTSTLKMIFIKHTGFGTRITTKYVFGVVRDVAYVAGEFEARTEKWVKVIMLDHDTSQHKWWYITGKTIIGRVISRNDKGHSAAVWDRRGELVKTAMGAVSIRIVKNTNLYYFTMAISKLTNDVVKYVNSRVSKELTCITKGKTHEYKQSTFTSKHSNWGHTIKLHHMMFVRISVNTFAKRYMFTKKADRKTKQSVGKKKVLASKGKFTLGITYATDSLSGERKVVKYVFTVIRVIELTQGEGQSKAARAARLATSHTITQFRKARLFKEDTSVMSRHKASKSTATAVVDRRGKLSKIGMAYVRLEFAKKKNFWQFKQNMDKSGHITKKFTFWIVRQLDYQKQDSKTVKVNTKTFKQLVKVIKRHVMTYKQTKLINKTSLHSALIFQDMKITKKLAWQMKKVVSSGITNRKVKGKKLQTRHLIGLSSSRNQGRFAYARIDSRQYTSGADEKKPVVQSVMKYLSHDLLEHTIKQLGWITVNMKKHQSFIVSRKTKKVWKTIHHLHRVHPVVKTGVRSVTKKTAIRDSSNSKGKVVKFIRSINNNNRYQVTNLKSDHIHEIILGMKVKIFGKAASDGAKFQVFCSHISLSKLYNHLIQGSSVRTLLSSWQYYRKGKALVIILSAKPSPPSFPKSIGFITTPIMTGRPTGVGIRNRYQVTEVEIKPGGPSKVLPSVRDRCPHTVIVFARVRLTSRVVYFGKTNDQNRKLALTLTGSRFKHIVLVRQKGFAPGGNGGLGVNQHMVVQPKKAMTMKTGMWSSFVEYELVQCRWYRSKLDLKGLVMKIEKGQVKRSKKKKKALAKNRIHAYHKRFGWESTFNGKIYTMSGFGVALNKTWKKKCPAGGVLKGSGTGKGSKGKGKGKGGSGHIRGEGYDMETAQAQYIQYRHVKIINIHTSFYVVTCEAPTYISETKNNINFFNSRILSPLMTEVSKKWGGFTFTRTRHRNNDLMLYTWDGMITDEDKISSFSMVRKWPVYNHAYLKSEAIHFETDSWENGRPHYLVHFKSRTTAKKANKQVVKKKG